MNYINHALWMLLVTGLLLCRASVDALGSEPTNATPPSWDEAETTGVRRAITLYLAHIFLVVDFVPADVGREWAWSCVQYGTLERPVTLTRLPREELPLGSVDRIADIGLTYNPYNPDRLYLASNRATWSIKFKYRTVHSEHGWLTDRMSVHNRIVPPSDWNTTLVPFLRQYVLPACDLWRLTPDDIHSLSARWGRSHLREFHAVLGLALSLDDAWADRIWVTSDVPDSAEAEYSNGNPETWLVLWQYRRSCKRRPLGRRCSLAIDRVFAKPSSSP
jgi:hypothetical protein